MAAEKLNNEQRMFALRMHAEGFSDGDIVRKIKELYNISMCWQSIQQTRNAIKYQPYVKHFRESYLERIKEVPIANKRIRLDKLQRECEKIERIIADNPTKTARQRGAYFASVYLLRKLLAEAREETEKNSHIFQNVVVNGLENMSDDAIEQRKADLIRRIRTSNGDGATGDFSAPAGEEPED